MKITEVRIFPTESKDGKLKAFATMTFDDWFVVRNVKVIQGNNGLFVAMPSRKAMESCPKCRFKNVVGSKFCNECGAPLGNRRTPAENAGPGDSQSSHMDIAHPITQECRVYIQEQILAAYNSDAGKKRPGPDEKKRSSEFAGNEAKLEEKISKTRESVPRKSLSDSVSDEDAQDIVL